MPLCLQLYLLSGHVVRPLSDWVRLIADMQTADGKGLTLLYNHQWLMFNSLIEHQEKSKEERKQLVNAKILGALQGVQRLRAMGLQVYIGKYPLGSKNLGLWAYKYTYENTPWAPCKMRNSIAGRLARRLTGGAVSTIM